MFIPVCKYISSLNLTNSIEASYQGKGFYYAVREDLKGFESSVSSLYDLSHSDERAQLLDK